MTSTAPTTGRPTTAGPDGAAVRLAGVSKSFGTVRAVRDLSLHIAPGEVVALLGRNGAGKSTTIDMLLGLTAPDSGTATLFGGTPDRAVRAGRVGAMLQNGALLPDLTVREMLLLFAGLQPHPLPVEEALERAGIADLGKRKTQNLSGGQTQRVRFALALIPDPDLIVLDEPTVAMDVEVRREFWSTMRAFAASGRTVLFATHYLPEADDFADRIVVISDGSVVADGSGAQLKATTVGRTVSAVVPGAGPQNLADLPGATGVEPVGGRLSIRTTASDDTLRALLSRHPDAHDIEVVQPTLEAAFLTLIGEQR